MRTNARTIVAIVGATATGKTELGEALAAAIGGEVLCADARQVFRSLDVGTGKPSVAERARQPHHLFDVLSLGETPNAGWYARLAIETCELLFARGVTPVLVGGSGLYLRALQHGLNAEPPHDPAIRARLQDEVVAFGVEVLHARLAKVDPPTAARLSVRDRQRITRALEVLEVSGHPLSWWHSHSPRHALQGDWRIAEVTLSPADLMPRIEARTRAMFAAGLLEETQGLVTSGQLGPLAALKAIGYDEALGLIQGRLSRSEAVAQMNARTRSMAKRQRTWFRNQIEGARLSGGGPPLALLARTRMALEL